MPRKLLVTSVFACFLKKRAKMPKNRFFLQKFPKFSESVRTHPNASRCIRMHPNASECIRTGPNRSEQVRKLRKIRENLENNRENFEKIAKISRKISRRLVFRCYFANVVECNCLDWPLHPRAKLGHFQRGRAKASWHPIPKK